MSVLAGLAAVVAAAVAVTAARRPVLARMAARGTARRRGETVLVVLGSLLGTAIITGSLIVGDTLHASIRDSATTQLGPTDLLVNSATPEAGLAAVDALADLSSQDVDGVLPLLRADAAVATGVGSAQRRAVPRAQLLEVDFGEATAFGADPAATGITGQTPAPGRAVLAQDLADKLAVAAGDQVEAYAYRTQVTLVVDRVLPRLGVAGFWTGFESSSMNVFVAPGTIEDLATGAAGPAQPPERLLLVSATGGVLDGAERATGATEDVRAALGDLPGVEVEPVKQDLLETADDAGASFSELFLGIGAFAVLAGVLLLVNIFVMLAEERKSELGTMRAVGLKRRDLVRLFVIEGSLYSLASALLGAAAGIGVGRVIVVVTSGIFANFDDGLTLRFTAQPDSVAVGFLAGWLISMATIVVTSVRISRVNIIRAIRDLPEPAGKSRRPWTAALLAAGTAVFGGLSVLAIVQREPLGGLAYPALSGVFVALLAARFLPRRPVVSLVSLLVLAYAVFGDRYLEFEGGDINVFVVQGVVLTFSAVALLSQNQEAVGRLVRALGRGRGLVSRLGLAYPLARRFRTSMTLAMYSLVVFTLVFISVLSSLFGTLTDDAVADEGGGYDILASSAPSNPVDAETLAATTGVASVATLSYGFAGFQAPGGPQKFKTWAVSGIDLPFVAQGPPLLDEWDDAYADADAVWQAVLDDPGLVVVDSFFLQDEGSPPAQVGEVGDVITARDPATGAVTERRIAAISRAGLAFSGVMASRDSVADMVSRAVPHRYYVKTEPGADAAAVATSLQGRFVEQGLQAESFRAIVEQNTQANLQFFRLMQGYLALGLVVGIAGLGVIMVRAVRERRRQIGMLRSLGFQSAKVRASFLLESGFVAFEGIIVGTALALLTSYQIVVHSDALGDFAVGFAVPWTQLAVLLSAALVASLAATAWPAQQASRIDPAVALRLAD